MNRSSRYCILSASVDGKVLSVYRFYSTTPVYVFQKSVPFQVASDTPALVVHLACDDSRSAVWLDDFAIGKQ